MSAPFLLARRYLSAGVRPTAFDFHTEGHKYPAARRSPSMKKEPSWWRLRQIRHRDAVILAVLAVSVGLTGPGILLGIGSHTLMGHYALMLKKHAKRIWRRWRKSRRPTHRSSKS